MYRYAQSALSAAGLQLRGSRAPPPQQQGAMHHRADSGCSGKPLGMYETVLQSVNVGHKATQEVAHGLVILARGFLQQTQLVGGLVRPLTRWHPGGGCTS